MMSGIMFLFSPPLLVLNAIVHEGEVTPTRIKGKLDSVIRGSCAV